MYTLSVLFVFARTQSLMGGVGGRGGGSSSFSSSHRYGPGIKYDGGGILFNRERVSTAQKFRIYPYSVLI